MATLQHCSSKESQRSSKEYTDCPQSPTDVSYTVSEIDGQLSDAIETLSRDSTNTGGTSTVFALDELIAACGTAAHASDKPSAAIDFALDIEITGDGSADTDGRLWLPHDLAACDDHVFVLDEGIHVIVPQDLTGPQGRIQRFSLDGKFELAWKHPVCGTYIQHLAVTPSCEVVAHVYSKRSLQFYSTDGEKLSSLDYDPSSQWLPTAMTQGCLSDIAVADDGAIALSLADPGVILLFDAQGLPNGHIHNPKIPLFPLSISFRSSGNLLIVNGGLSILQIFEMTRDGKLVKSWYNPACPTTAAGDWVPGMFQLPDSGSVIEFSGVIVLPENDPNKVSRLVGIRESSKLAFTFGGLTPPGPTISRGPLGSSQFRRVLGIDVDINSGLWVADIWSHRVRRYVVSWETLSNAQDL